ncbi:heavy metal translocating P-type ATPase [Vallitalea sp.]|jgi:Cd2+/Zn2+-exporting ATPase|uniref:heavy metal translocating P-type ATPase n=1 Tax=Vallitalea sp. TaxID=1882829 RepID=UPI0025D291D4|nr:heavy metal translocating P-type ATPase [Vallitalea sp.]MCT4688799.1 heavy metal translocating P-type ATPase [Vallitalea sp.]
MAERITDNIGNCCCGSKSCSSSNHHHDHDHDKHHHDHDHNHNHDVHGHNHEHHHHDKFTKKDVIEFIIGFGLFALALLLNVKTEVKIGLYVVAYIVVGREIVISAIKGLFTGRLLDENFLMTIASISAFAIGEYPEATAVMLFYRVGELFEGLAVNRSKNSIEELLNIKPDVANLKVGDKYKIVDPEKVKVGDTIMVKPGEKIPLDGYVIEGTSSIDTSVITGESLPREAQEGTEVYSGSINKSGVIIVKVTKEFSESTVAKILKLVKDANSQKAHTEKFITKFARYYTPIVVGIAVLLAFIPALFFGEDFGSWIYRAAIFLVVSCPCALVISIPLGYFGGIGGASSKGILVKGGNYLEELRNIKSIIFDKTGTLTKGVFKVTQVISSNQGMNKEKVVEIAAHVEHYSNHPIAISIINEYNKNIDEKRVKDITEVAGKGVKALFDGKMVAVGNRKLMEKENVPVGNIDTVIGTKVYVSMDNKLMGIIVIADELKNDTINAIKELKNHGVEDIVMLTGDHKDVAEDIANRVGITRYYSDLLPDQKVNKLEEIKNCVGKNNTVVFVGDGINDAPVLARADVGIAMGGVGSDAAIEAADVVLMSDELSSIPTAMRVSKNTNKIVWENIIFSLGVKIIIMILATLNLANMWMAIFADVGVAVIAILNSIRALRVK